MKEIATANELADWFYTASADNSVVYYRGFLASDARDGANVELSLLANTVWEHAVNGRLYLTQKRIADGCWEYTATRARTKVPDKLTPAPFDIIDHRAAYQRARTKRLREEGGARHA